MKELSIEDKAKRYDEAIEKLRSLHDDYDTVSTLIDIKEELENIFPELKESEDERIRKFLTKCVKEKMFVKSFMADGFDKDEVLAWLEKQGEQKPADKVEPKFKVGDWLVCCDYEPDQIIGIRTNVYEMSNGDIRPFYMIDNNYNIRLWTIQDAKDGDVLADGNLPFIFKKIDTNRYSYAYCGISVDDGFKIKSDGESGEWTWMQDIKPATQEQRDLLFQKMKEAGYEWDTDKKELKKIELNSAWSEEDERIYKVVLELIDSYSKGTIGSCIIPPNVERYARWFKALKDRCLPKSKQEWSEEDEKILNLIIARLHSHPNVEAEEYGKDYHWLKSLKDRVQPKQEWSKEDKEQLDRALYMMEQLDMTKSWDDVYNWLKSLRPQNTWKPSDEQMEALYEETQESDRIRDERIVSLYEDLKKLKTKIVRL